MTSKNTNKPKTLGRPRKAAKDLSPAYRKRLAAGKAKGVSRSQAYGHAKKSELSLAKIKETFQKIAMPRASTHTKLIAANKGIQSGMTRSEALKKAGLSAKTWNRWEPELQLNQTQYPRSALVPFKKGSGLGVTNAHLDYPTTRIMGKYWEAVGKAIKEKNPDHLKPYENMRIIDLNGQKYTLNTNLSQLTSLEKKRRNEAKANEVVNPVSSGQSQSRSPNSKAS